jgi:hypothetical protein
MFYCGKEDPPPEGRSFGTANQCFKKGLSAGFAAGANMGEKRGKVKGKLVGALQERTAVGQKVRRKGFAGVKRDMRLSTMGKDEVRSVLQRYTGTANAVPGYSRMSVADMRQQLVNRGWNM